METNHKNCVYCTREIKGRSDKKFCNDQCRNSYNNQVKLNANFNEVRNINNALLRNRRILSELLNGERELIKVTGERLKEEGFSFKYLTHIYTTKKGKTYFYCYEFGYLPLENDWYLVVKNDRRPFAE